MTISTIKFFNYKAFKNYSVTLATINILVGPNNSGKSTIISAFRILDYALRIANARNASRVNTYEDLTAYGHKLSADLIPTSIENVHTDYSVENSKIEFHLTNKNILTLFFSFEGACSVYWTTQGKSVSTPSSFAKEFPLNIQVVPVLGPIEQIEEIVTDETVKKSAGTPRAARHFRNYWYKNPEGFDDFKELVEKTWPGMSIKFPELTNVMDKRLVMFCSENRVDRELFWAGFGFQIWCQLLTHISRVKKASLIVIDEPEVYLHPDVQRQLLNILREISPDIILATHSTEILGEADPYEILLVDKSKNSAKRLRDIEGIQEALSSIGSVQNITLTQLARTKKIVFFEGLYDFKILRRFAKIAGHNDLAAGSGITPFESGGFTSRDRVKALAWGIKNTLGADIRISAVYDRDYWCDAQIAEMLTSLEKDLSFCHVHAFKEIENYLLHPGVLSRSVEKAIKEKEKRDNNQLQRNETVDTIIDKLSAPRKYSLQGQYIGKFIEYHKSSGKDAATLSSESIKIFEDKWSNLYTRMTIIDGKEFLGELRTYFSSKWGITLTDARITDEFKIEDISTDLMALLNKIEAYRLF